MTNNTYKNSGCGFAEQLVSYLYGETGAAENTEFTAHLQTCAACAEEVEAFSGVQFSIGDWKAQEFASLATPFIEIPYEKAEKPQTRIEVSDVGGSWISGLRNLFSTFSSRSLATASIAVLAAFIVIALIIINSGKGKDIAATNQNTKPAFSPTVEKTIETTTADKHPDFAPEKEEKKIYKGKTQQPEMAVAPDRKNNRAGKSSGKTPQPKQAETSKIPKPRENKRSNKNINETAPNIIEDEDFDETLRLAELFEEIDTVE